VKTICRSASQFTREKMTHDLGSVSRLDADDRTEELLIEQATCAVDPHVRRYSLYLLGKERDPRLKDLFLSALRDTDKGTRAQAMAALADLGDTVVPDLVSLLSDDDWKVRYRAAEALGKMRNRESVEPLIRALSDGKDHVRYMAAKTLGELGDQKAVPPLVERLDDENPHVRKAAVISLQKIGDASGMAAAERRLASEQSDMVREAMKSVLSGEK